MSKAVNAPAGKAATISTGAPEDLALDGSMGNTFESEGVTFDQRHGSFVIAADREESVYLSGTGLPNIWTKRALAREGFRISKSRKSCRIRINISSLKDKNEWDVRVGDDRCSCNSIYELIRFIHNHVRPLHLFIAKRKGTLTNKGITRFFITCGDNTPCLLLHSIADMKGKGDKGKEEFIEFAKNMILKYFSEFMPRKKISALITGNDLINKFGLSPSPLFKKIISSIEEARLSNQINTKQEALALIKKILTQVSHPSMQLKL